MLTRQRSTSHHAERQWMVPNERIAVVMVGLPARGKSYMAKKVYRYLHHLQIITKVFNFGSYRRIATKNTTVGKASASFFDPDNKQGAKIRQQCCIDALHDLISWYNTGGQIGILDATNTTLQRRQLIREFFHNKISELEYNVSILHIESICNDESIIHNNIITVKLKNPDYCTVDAQKAIKDFKERIKMYKKAYTEVRKDEGSYIKVINVGSDIEGHEINHYISCRIFYFLMHLHLNHITKSTKKPLLMQMKNMKDTRKDNEMVDRLKKISASVGAKFTRPKYDRPVPALAPHMRRPSYLMWTESEESPKRKVKHVQIVNINTNTKPDFGLKTKLMSKNASVNGSTDTSLNESFQFQKANITPLKLDNATRFDESPALMPSVTSMTPTVTTPMMNRPKVRRSTLIHRMISKRDLVIEESAKCKSANDLTNIATENDKGPSGYVSDDEEESDIKTDMTKKPYKSPKFSPIAEGFDIETSDDESEDFDCEICGRSVKRSETMLVDSKYNPQKVRICEVCLYETDTEDDTSDNSEQMIDIMHSGPTSMMASAHASRNGTPRPTSDMQRKMQEMENSVSVLLNQLNSNSDSNTMQKKNFKRELVELQQKMEGMFQ